MSKFSKLMSNPKGYFVDALKIHVPVSKLTPPAAKNVEAKPPAKKPEAKPPAKKPEVKPAAKKTEVKPAPKAPAKPPAKKPEISEAQKKSLKITGQIELLTSMFIDGEYDLIKRAWAAIESSTSSNADKLKLINLQAEAELAGANHDEVMFIGREMIRKHNSSLGYYYRAHSLFVRGKYEEAMLEIQNILRLQPNHANSVYLYCEICEHMNEHESAWKALEKLALTSRRNKTWHVMANLVRKKTELMRLLNNWDKWKKKVMDSKYHQDVYEFVTLGALRVGNFEMARSLWRESVMEAAKQPKKFVSLKNRTPSYSMKRAENALSDLNNMFKDAQIEMFLVSGTLLGAVREGRLLGHDKDIDIGIWSTVPEEKIGELATTSGLFYVLKSRSPEILRLKHVNGIAIDVFYHFREPEDYWHGGVKMVWHNTPFTLIKHEFLGEEYLIPEDYDLYLSENYGDWVTPMLKFDSAFDTPNGEVKSEDEMAIHTFKGLLASAIDDNWEKVAFYHDKLSEFDEGDFAEQFIEECVTSEEAKAAFEEYRISQEEALLALEEEAELEADAETDEESDAETGLEAETESEASGEAEQESSAVPNEKSEDDSNMIYLAN